MRRAVAGLLLALALGSSVAARPVPISTTSQCHTGEAVVYSCRFGTSLASVCGTRGSVHYRFGPPGHPAIDIASRSDWGNVRTGTIVGNGSGHQTHIRFAQRGYDYVVYEAQAGRYTDISGKRWSGIHVQRADRDVMTRECPVRATLQRAGIENLSQFAPGDIDLEDHNTRFDIWY